MFSTRSLRRIAIALGALAFALPAAAGTLSPQLRTLAKAYHKAPQTTVAQLASATAAPTPRLFAPHVSAAGKVQVYIHYRSGAMPGSAVLSHLGATDVRVSRALGVVQAWVPITNLGKAAALVGITHIGLPVYARIKGHYDAHPAASCNAVPSGLAIDQEGITAENVDPVHDQGITGEGVKVGIISNGADCIADSQAQGYLPNDVLIVEAGSGSEGVAMMEEVHAMAPDASLGFCGPATTVDFLDCLDQFATQGANVISDDLGFFPVTYNQSVFDNPATGVNGIVEFAEAHPDISLTTSAGNSKDAYLEADYSADTTPRSPDIGAISLSPTYTIGQNQYLADYSAADRSYASAMDFGAALGKASNAAVTVTIFPGGTLYGDLTWNDPVAGPYDDLDLFLLKADGSVACTPASDGSKWCNSTLDQMTYADAPDFLPPFEFLDYTNDTDSTQTLYLVALCYDCNAHGSQPLHVKLYGFGNGGAVFDYTTDGGVAGHAALGVEVTTAAAYYRNQGGVKSTIESFSSTGPFTYGDWTSALKTRAKPDITGIDQVTVSGAGGFPSPFYGTSAASPNVGSVLALLRSGFPDAEPNAAGWNQVITATASTRALTNYTVNAGGAGLVDAAAAASSLAGGSIAATITSPPVSPFETPPNTDVAFAATCEASDDQTLSYNWAFGGNSGIPDSEQLIPDPVRYANGGIYTVTFTCSAGAQSGSDQVTVAVQAAATANDQTLDTGHNQTLTGALTGSGLGGEQLSFVRVEDASHGSVQIAGDGGFSYMPNKGFSGEDSFQFRINNGVKKSNTATVSITVAEGSPPVASDGILTTDENKAANGTLQATDPDGDALTFSIVASPEHGSVAITSKSNGTYTYTPDDGYSGADSFTFKANDGSADSNTAKVSITVKAVSSGGGGGGALGGLGLGLLACLVGLALFLRRRS